MAIPQDSHYNHWNYFLNLEQDLIQLSRFIEFSEDNYETYSQELAKVFLTASSEADVVLKEICKILGLDKKKPNICDYRKIIQNKLPDIINETVFINRYGLKLRPWNNWKGNLENNPNWWCDHNNVKHNRSTEFQKANLKNTLNSMAALAIVNLYYHYFLLAGDSQIPMSDVFVKLNSTPDFFNFKEDHHFSLKKGPKKCS